MTTAAKGPRRRRVRHSWWYWPLRVRVVRLHPHKKAWKRGRWLARLKARVMRQIGGTP